MADKESSHLMWIIVVFGLASIMFIGLRGGFTDVTEAIFGSSKSSKIKPIKLKTIRELGPETQSLPSEHTGNVMFNEVGHYKVRSYKSEFGTSIKTDNLDNGSTVRSAYWFSGNEHGAMYHANFDFATSKLESGVAMGDLTKIINSSGESADTTNGTMILQGSQYNPTSRVDLYSLGSSKQAPTLKEAFNQTQINFVSYNTFADVTDIVGNSGDTYSWTKDDGKPFDESGTSMDASEYKVLSSVMYVIEENPAFPLTQILINDHAANTNDQAEVKIIIDPLLSDAIHIDSSRKSKIFTDISTFDMDDELKISLGDSVLYKIDPGPTFGFSADLYSKTRGFVAEGDITAESKKLTIDFRNHVNPVTNLAQKKTAEQITGAVFEIPVTMSKPQIQYEFVDGATGKLLMDGVGKLFEGEKVPISGILSKSVPEGFKYMIPKALDIGGYAIDHIEDSGNGVAKIGEPITIKYVYHRKTDGLMSKFANEALN